MLIIPVIFSRDILVIHKSNNARYFLKMRTRINFKMKLNCWCWIIISNLKCLNFSVMLKHSERKKIRKKEIRNKERKKLLTYQCFWSVHNIYVTVGNVGEDEGSMEFTLGWRDVGHIFSLACALGLTFNLWNWLVHRPQWLISWIGLKWFNLKI